MNIFDISKYPGKKQRLITAIRESLATIRPPQELPSVMLLTAHQYSLIKRCKELGHYREQKDWAPEDRIFATEFSAMELRIVK